MGTRLPGSGQSDCSDLLAGIVCSIQPIVEDSAELFDRTKTGHTFEPFASNEAADRRNVRDALDEGPILCSISVAGPDEDSTCVLVSEDAEALVHLSIMQVPDRPVMHDKHRAPLEVTERNGSRARSPFGVGEGVCHAR